MWRGRGRRWGDHDERGVCRSSAPRAFTPPRRFPPWEGTPSCLRTLTIAGPVFGTQVTAYSDEIEDAHAELQQVMARQTAVLGQH